MNLRGSSRCQGQCSKSWIGGPPRMSYTRLTHGLFGDGVGTDCLVTELVLLGKTKRACTARVQPLVFPDYLGKTKRACTVDKIIKKKIFSLSFLRQPFLLSKIYLCQDISNFLSKTSLTFFFYVNRFSYPRTRSR